MDIQITISDKELSASDKALIKGCLGLKTDPELNTALTKLCKAAFMEYVKMFKEKGLPTRADEVQQERLAFLINHYFEERLPRENEISSIFQLTQSQSRTLLRNTKSRYRTKITKVINNTLLNTLNSAKQSKPDKPYEFVCLSSSTVEELNSIISQKGPTLEPIEKIKGRSNQFSCAISS
jgi:hypothetical protein